jgi:hypothetical protein
MEHFLTGFFCRKKDFWHIQSCRGENSNLAEFAQMRQKRMGIGAIKTSFGGIGPMCQKGTFLVGWGGAPGHLWCTKPWKFATRILGGMRVLPSRQMHRGQ